MGSPAIALCYGEPFSVTQQPYNYNMDNRFLSCCLFRFPLVLFITELAFYPAIFHIPGLLYYTSVFTA